MLVITRKHGESVMIADDIEVTVLRLSGNRVYLGVRGPKQVPIRRKELPEVPRSSPRAECGGDLDRL
jgi:carbon storage regulator